MFDPLVVVAIVLLVVSITSGISISIGDINIANKTNEKDDN